MATSITTSLGLEHMANNLAEDYTLDDDINISGDSDWTPVGSSTTPFTGSLIGSMDGDLPKYYIIGLTISSYNSYLGLFGYLSSADVKHIGFSDVSITIRYNNTFVGTVAGYATDSNIWRVYIDGEIVINGSGTKSDIGGIVGKEVDCSIWLNTITIAMSLKYNYSNVGGIVGRADDGYISTCNSYITINTTNDSGSNVIGGVAGLSYECNISKTKCVGSITASECDYVGGIIGFGATTVDSAGKLSNNGFYGIIEAHDYVGGVAGCITKTHLYFNYVLCGIIAHNYVGGLIGFYTGGVSCNVQYNFVAGSLDGNLYVSGMVGRINQTGISLSKCVSGIKFIDGATGNINRMFQYNTAGIYASDCYAWVEMRLNGSTVTSSDDTDVNGKDLATDDFWTDDQVFSTSFYAITLTWSATSFDISDNKYYKLPMNDDYDDFIDKMLEMDVAVFILPYIYPYEL